MDQGAQKTDVRKDFILTTSENYFGISLPKENFFKLNIDSFLDNFLDDPSCFTLSVSCVDSEHGRKLLLDTKVTPGGDSVLVFFKVRAEVVTPENLHSNVFVSSMVDSPVCTLYHAIKTIYAPVLLQDDEWSSSFDPKLQDLISQLESGLRNLLEKSGTSAKSVSKDLRSNMALVMCPEEEVDFWSNVANTTRRKDELEMAKSFYKALEPLGKEFSTLEALPLMEADTVLETADSALDDLWRLDEFPYPQRRMEHLMDVIGNGVVGMIQRRLKQLNVWEEPYSSMEELLNQGSAICDKWVTTCERLTGFIWSNYTPHMWDGAPFVPSHTKNFVNRLGEILQLRTIHRQLTRLLTSREQEELHTADTFRAFSGLCPVLYNPYTEKLWRAAIAQFEHSLVPMEERVAGKLRAQLKHINANTLQLLYEFKRYQELIERPIVRNALVAERESLLAALREYLHSVSTDFNAGRTGGAVRLVDMPEVISNIYWVRQLECKVGDMERTGVKILSDLRGFKELQGSTGALLRDLKEFHTDQFDGWTREVGMAIHNKSLSLNTDEAVVQFERGQLMHVNYNPRLVGLVREVRQLAVLGYKIPLKIQEAADLAKRFMRQAKALEQVANFHNTIGDRMIPSQRPMMLEAALEMARLVKEQTGVTWGDTAAVDTYIARLQSVVERLSRENNKLASYHAQISDKVIALMNTDLLRHQQQWKDGLKDIRGVVGLVESQKFSNMKSWRSHWDRQLYKALEHQYQVGLAALDQHLPEIKIELVYRQQNLQFRPPMEEIRMKYYGQLKRFLSIPNNFRGVSDSQDSQIFPTIIDRNGGRFSHLFSRAEHLFVRLEMVKERWRHWVALGSLDLDQLAEQHLHTAEDWDRNFRASKTCSQEIAKLPSTEEKVECFSVSFLPVRAEVELHNRRYWDTLVSSLQISIVRDVGAIDKFISESTQTLSRQPHSVEEIGQANVRHGEIMALTPQMLQVYEEAERKNKTLASWTKERVEQLSHVTSLWDNFQTMVDNYQYLISKQVESIKNSLSTQVDNLRAEAEKFQLRWEQLKPRETSLQDGGEDTLLQSLTTLRDKRQEWQELLEQRETLSKDCLHFVMEPPELTLFEEIESDLKKHEDMWSLFDEFNKGLQSMSQEEWIIFRSKTYKFEEFLCEWQERLKNSRETTLLTVRLLQDLDRYKEMLPWLKFVHGDMFCDKHWMEMFALIGLPSKPVECLTFGDFLATKDNIIARANDLQELNGRAVSEIAIRQALRELDIWEVEAKFSLTEHKDSRGQSVMLIKDFKDILNKVGDNQCLLQSIKNSANYNSFIDRASIWETRLADLDQHLHNLNLIQRKWVYLEPIFGAGTMSQDQARFQRVDHDFRYIMADVSRDSKVVSLCRISNLHQILDTLLDQLSRCQKSLNDFLEEKRSAFPRFYFLGDEDLLEILGQSTKPRVIQAHLKKLFVGIHSVTFDPSEQHVTAIRSLERETVPLKQHVELTAKVEEWLCALEKEMKSTLRQLLVECVSDVEQTKSEPDPLKFPSQVLCLCESVLFTRRCEEAITNNSLQHLLSTLKQQLEAYTSLEVEWTDTPGDTEGDSRDLELKLKAMLLDTIHHMSVVEHLLAASVKQVNSWHWQRQLRFYLRKDGVAVVRMVDAQFEYTYEYQGNATKLVHTPLTDKCYLTLTQGMHMGLGGNPYGPAGTGKTESVKALGGLLGRQVLVFNCDEGIDVKSMARIFVGLVKCGAWGCFDEFNRLEETTLSAVSMQIQPIQTALKNHHTTVRLMDQEIPLDINSGIFVTLNPVGKGYGGRQKLPDNLKQLFRPVVMSRPDNELIAEVILYCEGFKHAKTIGKKLVEVFDMARKLLSVQQHYDWGLRALKTVLGGCGSVLKAARKSGISVAQLDKEAEMELVVQALRLNTLSKLTFTDCAGFDGIVRDMFPGIPFTSSGYETLTAALKESYAEFGLLYNESQLRKCVELFEQLQQRMGVVIVGPSGSGKTTLCNLLKSAILRLGGQVKQHIINPKAMPRSQLLGHIDLDTRQWTDGVLTLSAQQVYSEPPEVHSWVVCDGDVDPEWIESLNSVLDDNRLLTLPSGWRIQFGPNVNFIFETHDLSYASPATVSRMGIIFLSDEDINVEGLVFAWLNTQPENTTRFLAQLIEDHFYKAVHWIAQQGELVVTTSLVGIVMNGLSQLHGVSTRAHFTVALVQGLGGNLSLASREVFAKQVFQWTSEFVPDNIRLLYACYNHSRDCVDSYSMSPEDEHLHLDTYRSSLPLVMTADVKRTVDVLGMWLEPDTRQPFLLVGPQGCGKSLILSHCFNKLRATEVSTIHCSAQITPQHVLQKLSQVCMVISSNTGRVYRPKNSGHLILYFKDLNLARPDKWGTSMLIAFLQQVITYRGFYDSSNLEWVGLEHVQIVGSMTSEGAMGRHKLNPRFTSITRIYSVSYPERDQLKSMYNLYLSHIMAQCLPNHSNWGNATKIASLATTMITVYEEVKVSLTPMQQNHYLFTPKDLTRWCLAMLRYNLKQEDPSVNSVLEVFVYEGMRLFQDKLVSEEDKSKFDNILNKTLESNWGRGTSTYTLSDSYFVTVGAESPVTPGAPLPTYGKPLGKLEGKDWLATVNQGILQFGREGQTLDLLVFQEVLDLVARVDRALSVPRGCLLLAGRAGVGRKSAVRIVSALHEAKLHSLKLGRGYTVKNFKNDLKAMIQLAAVDGEQVYLMIEDHQLVHISFLDMINSLLLSGEVPGLYNLEELEPIVSSLRDLAAQEGYIGNPASFFAERVQRNLHVILVMDFTNTQFTPTCESNPALYKECCVLWLPGWSSTSMRSVPNLLLLRSGCVEEGGDLVDTVLNDGFFTIHSQVSNTLRTPRRYMAFIHTYIHIFTSKKSGIQQRCAQLQAGVSKLTEARLVVDSLKSEAANQEQRLAEKQAKANSALQMITETMRSANSHKTEMECLKEQTEKENQQLVVRKRAIDEELAEIEPLIREATAAVGNIKSESLSEIRSMRAPPEVIRDILEGVLRLMGILDTSWNSMKIFLAKRGVKEDIRSFDARQISRESRLAVEKLLQEKGESFDPKTARRASTAAAPLAAWVMANVQYSHVLEKISPLEQEQAKLQHNLMMAKNQIGQLSSGLSDVDRTVAKLKDQLNTYTREAAEIEIHLNRAQETINAAEGLVEKLNDEYNRWKTQLGELSKDLTALPLNSLLGAACITYLSSAPEDSRRSLLGRWQEVLGVHQFSLTSFLGSEKEQLQWLSEGLPSDELSVHNALIILKIALLQPGASLRPFLVDPSSLASDWLKRHLSGDSNVEVVSQHSQRFTTTLELAIRFGKVLIIQEVDTVDPILFSVLRGDFIQQGPRKVVQLGDKLIDYNDNFQLFLTTRNSEPDIAPDAAATVTFVNFTTTLAGLTGQLLACAVCHERPELEKRRAELLRQEEELKLKVDQLQEVVLQELATAQGDILQNKELLSSLNEAKSSSAAIYSSLSESSRLQAELRQECDVYRPLAECSSQLFFAIRDLHKVNNMYQFSSSAFIRLFNKALSTEHKGGDASVAEHQKTLQQLVYQYVSRSLFKADRLSLALHLVHTMYSKHLLENEWQVLTGQAMADVKVDTSKISQSVPGWLSEERAFDVFVLKSALPELYSQLNLDDKSTWSNFSTAGDCEEHFPVQLSHKLTPFQRVLIVQALRPDRLHSSLLHFTAHILGLQDLSPPTLSLKQLMAETLSSEPVLLVISAGADPSEELRVLAHSIVGAQRYHEVAMGQSQAGAALELITSAAHSGEWVCLKNIHLMTAWLPSLEKELRALDLHDDFRLWLTTEAHPRFPGILAESCLKVTYEAPQGVKKNMLRTYTTWGPDLIPSATLHARALFALAWFHAVVQERRTFVPQGWAKFYEFSDADLRVSMDILAQLFRAGPARVPWEFVHGLYEGAIYGGHVDNLHDLHVIGSYLREFFNPAVLEQGSQPLGLSFHIPSSASYKDYISAIQQLSDTDKPEYFGLPANVERSLQRITSRQVISQLNALTRPVEGVAKFDREEWQLRLAPVLNLWKKLNQSSGLIQLKIPDLVESSGAKGPLPVPAFVSEEFRGALQLVQHLHKCLAAISKVIRGSHLPSGDTLLAAERIMSQQTPEQWMRKWEGPTEPLPYLRSVVSRALAVQRWNTNVSQGVLLKLSLDLADLFHPDTFLCALKQQTAREYTVPLDELGLTSSWTKNGLPAARLPVTLAGLQLEGATFNGLRLTPNTADTPSVCAAPGCTVAWMPKGDFPVYHPEEIISLPVYFTAAREHVLVNLDVPCAGNQDKWVQTGTAFFLRT